MLFLIRMRKKLIFLTLIASFLFLFASPSQALRKRTRKPRESSGPSVSYSARGIQTNVRFRPDRQALLISFSNFDNVESVSYELLYNANGLAQGVGGMAVIGDTETKTLFFGTCSSGVCTSHRNITNARLSIRSILKDGTVVLKPFRIKV